MISPNPLAVAQTDASSQPPSAPPAKALDAAPVQPQTPPKRPGPTLPESLTVKPLDAGQYVLEFNRSPVVGNRFRLRGIYDESRLRFTRPRNWEPKTVQVSLRYRHSGALYATRSNLTVLLNGASIGSVPLNRKHGELGTATFKVPPNLIQDYNEIVIAALQNNSPTCTQDPFDPSLWSEILPDSKVVFDFQPQPINLDFNRYPYPIFDNLNLEPNLIAYLLPQQIDETWLTTAARLQTSLGRHAQFRPLETRLVNGTDPGKPGERLVMIGTPKSQSSMADLNLPLSIQNQQLLDEHKQPLPPDVGVLMLAPSSDSEHVVLIATGNGPLGVEKAVQFLVQARDRQIGVGRLILVKQIENVSTPAMREWPGYLPTVNSFQLKDLKDFNQKPLDDVTVRGAEAPPIEFDFKALPDDRFGDNNRVNLHYSYSPQVNPLTSLIEVQLDGLPIFGKRLDNEKGALRETLSVELPADKIRPHSKLQVRFQLDSREQRSCNRAIDQQLWGTVHADTEIHLNRDVMAQVPDLKLLQTGFPFAAPQDLSQTAIVLPNQPTRSDVLLLLQLSERLGRLSRADSVKLNVYRANQLPSEQRNDHHLVAIGTQATFPLPEAFQAAGFALQDLFTRRRDQIQVTALPDEQGVVKEIVSPWNQERVLLALSGQTEQGLDHVRDLLKRDDLFFQMREDTLLISANHPNPLPYDPQAYTLEFLPQARQQHALTIQNPVQRLMTQLSASWFILIPATLGGTLILYGVLQVFLKRVTQQEKK